MIFVTKDLYGKDKRRQKTTNLFFFLLSVAIYTLEYGRKESVVFRIVVFYSYASVLSCDCGSITFFRIFFCFFFTYLLLTIIANVVIVGSRRIFNYKKKEKRVTAFDDEIQVLPLAV